MDSADLRKEIAAAYIDRKTRHEHVTLKSLAQEFGIEYSQVARWRREGAWDSKVPKGKRGAPKGNKNSQGKRNAAGPHKGNGPKGYKNAEKDGAYSTVDIAKLPAEEQLRIQATPVSFREALEDEMRVLKYRERKILDKLEQYELADEAETRSGVGITYLDTETEMHGDQQSIVQNKDSAFSRMMKLQEALIRIQGRILKIVDIIRATEEADRKYRFEAQKLEMQRMRISGAVEVDFEEVDSQ